jgi:hypothetical protein
MQQWLSDLFRENFLSKGFSIYKCVDDNSGINPKEGE